MSRAIFYTLKISKFRRYSLAFLDLKNKKLDLKTYFLAFLNLKNYCFSLYISKICLKSQYFTPFLPNFLPTFFWVPHFLDLEKNFRPTVVSHIYAYDRAKTLSFILLIRRKRLNLRMNQMSKV